MEYKSIGLEVKDLDKGSRTAIVAHAVYNNIDRVKDISRKGMFTKSWSETKDDIAFYLNHEQTQAPGKVVDVFEDEQKAYTKVWLGTHTLGNDTLIMMDEGIIKKASFGYVVTKSGYLQKGVREIKEVQHLETSVLTKLPANPLAGVVKVQKSWDIDIKALSESEQNFIKRLAATNQATLIDLVMFSQNLQPDSDLYTWINYQISRCADSIGDLRYKIKWELKELKELSEHISVMEKFIRNTNASDECIKTIEQEMTEAKALLSKYDTDFTSLIRKPESSRKEVDMDLFTLKLKQ